MKLSTLRAVDLFGSERARDRLFVRAWAGSSLDPELGRLVTAVLAELDAAETEIARLKLEAADLAETRASQEELGLRERPHLIDMGREREQLRALLRPHEGMMRRLASGEK